MRGFDYKIVGDPEIFSINRLPARSDHEWYGSEDELLMGENSLSYSLNGTWKFFYAVNEAAAPQNFEEDAYDCRNWADIRVPAHIQMEGYGKPQYSNIVYPWEEYEHLMPGELPSKFNPAASYVRYFTLPAAMQGKRIIIRFNGVESGMALWLNGEFIGYSEDSFDPAEFDLTPAIREGENKLAVRVWRWTAGSWCEDQDFFRFCGIFRNVTLLAAPETHVNDVSIVPTLNDDFSEGTLSVTLKTVGEGRICCELQEVGVMTSLEQMRYSCGAEPVGSGRTECVVSSGKEETVQLSIGVSSPGLWSAESPYLYRTVIRVYNGDGQLTEMITRLIGFRRFEVRDGIMQLNGRRIVFKGVNRHEFSDVRGRVPAFEDALTDVTTMKRNNINAIRLCHYPDERYIYDLCDIFGIYLIAENNMETHGTWDMYYDGSVHQDEIIPNDKPEWRPLLLDRVRTCYEVNKNHPSILIWSCGNESFGGTVIRDMAQLFRDLDKHRVVHYEGIFWDRRYPETSDIESQMYTPADDIRKFLREHREKPMICCEYAHAMGNSCGALHKYTELTEQERLYQGGFIWDYIDQALQKKDRYGRIFEAYGGDFDERPHDGEFCGDGIVYAEGRSESPKMQEVRYCYSNIRVSFAGDRYTVINNNLFTDISAYDVEIRLLADGQTVCRRKADISVGALSSSEFGLPQDITGYIERGEKAARAAGTEPAEYTVEIVFTTKSRTLWCESGYEVACEQSIRRHAVREHHCDIMPELVMGHRNFTVRGRDFSAMFSIDGLISYEYCGVQMLSNYVPRPNFWRAPTANDRGNCMAQRYAQWKLASMYATTRYTPLGGMLIPTCQQESDGVRVDYTYYLATQPESYCKVSYKVYGDGYVQITMSYEPVSELGDMPEFGMLMKMNADYDTLTWYGLGPEETYADRQHGGRLGIYTNHVEDNVAKYLVPQECGNKCGVRWARVTDHQGRGLEFSGAAMSFSALPYTPHELENADHLYELPEKHYTVIRAAEAQMGVAGDNGWGARTHPEYLVDVSGPKQFTFGFRGV